MSKLVFFMTFAFAVTCGLLEGEVLSLVRKENHGGKYSNWMHGIVGAFAGWLFGCGLPTLPEFRPWFALFTSLYGAAIYLFLQLFFTHKRFIGITKVRSHKI